MLIIMLVKWRDTIKAGRLRCEKHRTELRVRICSGQDVLSLGGPSGLLAMPVVGGAHYEYGLKSCL